MKFNVFIVIHKDVRVSKSHHSNPNTTKDAKSIKTNKYKKASPTINAEHKRIYCRSSATPFKIRRPHAVPPHKFGVSGVPGDGLIESASQEIFR
jgi:hypothetical protein